MQFLGLSGGLRRGALNTAILRTIAARRGDGQVIHDQTRAHLGSVAIQHMAVAVPAARRPEAAS